MKTQTRTSLNVWHGLLFLHGHIADAGLARTLAEVPASQRRPGGSLGLHPAPDADAKDAFEAPARCA